VCHAPQPVTDRRICHQAGAAISFRLPILPPFGLVDRSGDGCEAAEVALAAS
jgi:hypothetical protein